MCSERCPDHGILLLDNSQCASFSKLKTAMILIHNNMSMRFQCKLIGLTSFSLLALACSVPFYI